MTGTPGAVRNPSVFIRLILAVTGSGAAFLVRNVPFMLKLPWEPFLQLSVGSVLAAAFLVPFWLPVSRKNEVTGVSNPGTAAFSALVLHLPVVVAVMLRRPVFTGFSAHWFVMALYLFLLAAFEEFLCRGFLMDVLSLRGGRVTGLLLSSAVFAVLHLGNDSVSVIGVVNVFLVGVMFGMMRLVSGGLLYPILTHWAWNLVTGLVFGLPVSGIGLGRSLFRVTGRLPWSEFGPEGSLLMTIGILGGIVVSGVKLRGIGMPYRR